MPLIVILIISGLLTVTYFSGPKSNSEQNLEPPQSQVKALPINSPDPNKEETVSIRNKKTGEIKQVPKSGAANYIDTPKPQPQTTKASDKSLRLAAYIFAVIKGDQRTEFLNKFSNGKNDLALAVNNLALMLDNKPELLALVEKAIAQDLAQKATNNTEDSSNTVFNDLEYPDPIPNSEAKTYGNTNSYNNYQAPSSLSNNYTYTHPKPTPTPDPTINVYGGADSYTRYGNTVYGSDGSSYTQYGNTVYGNDGSSYTKYGNTIYGNDGSTSTKYGNTTYGNDGTSYTQYGNTTYGSDGSSYTQYGNTVYTEPGY